MKKLKTTYLSENRIKRLIDMKAALKVVEDAFVQFARGNYQMPSKIYLDLKSFNGDFRAMPSYLGGIESCALKWVNVHPDNVKRGLPTVMATMILSDPKTGFPLSVMDASYLTSLRTGAAGGIAAKYLARKQSSVIALVGCGEQAQSQLDALRCLFKLKKVNVWGPNQKERALFIRRKKSKNEIFVSCVNIKDCVADADIIITTTPSRKPLIKYKWLKEGVHINAIGADAKGKMELEPLILKKSKLVIDDWQQASHSGEINVALSRKIISKKSIHSDLGSIVIKKKKGRVNHKEITVFDSTGLGIQDVAVGFYAYKKSKNLPK